MPINKTKSFGRELFEGVAVGMAAIVTVAVIAEQERQKAIADDERELELLHQKREREAQQRIADDERELELLRRKRERRQFGYLS